LPAVITLGRLVSFGRGSPRMRTVGTIWSGCGGRTRHVYPDLGQRALAEIGPDDIQAWVKRISEDLAGSTVGVVDRVDSLRGVVKVDRQAVALAKRPISFGPPKRRASYRDIPIPRDVVEVLSAHLAEFGTGDHGLIFPAKDGGFMRRSTFSGTIWKPVQKAAGLESGSGLHTLRHYYASRLIRFGESVKTVQTRLGHASAQETLDTYGHLWQQTPTNAPARPSQDCSPNLLRQTCDRQRV